MRSEWIEINIEVKPKPDVNQLQEAARTILVELVDSLVRRFKAVATGEKSWHYLWESNPWSLTLRLRFYGDSQLVNNFKKVIEEYIAQFRSKYPDLIGDYCYGRHGVCGEKYDGEIDRYREGWKLVSKMLEFGAETALELIKNLEKYGDPLLYADRYVHLFLDQMAFFVDEINFYFDQFLFRYYLSRKGREPNIEWLGKVKTKVLNIVEQMLRDPSQNWR